MFELRISHVNRTTTLLIYCIFYRIFGNFRMWFQRNFHCNLVSSDILSRESRPFRFDRDFTHLSGARRSINMWPAGTKRNKRGWLSCDLFAPYTRTHPSLFTIICIVFVSTTWLTLFLFSFWSKLSFFMRAVENCSLLSQRKGKENGCLVQ